MPKHNERENLTPEEKKARHESARLMHQIPADYPPQLAWPRVFGFRVVQHATGYSEPGPITGAYATLEEAQTAMLAAIESGESISWRGQHSLLRKLNRIENTRDKAIYAAREARNAKQRPFIVALEKAQAAATNAYYAERDAAEIEMQREIEKVEAQRHGLVFDSTMSAEAIKAAINDATRAYKAARTAIEKTYSDKVNAAYEKRSAALIAAENARDSATAEMQTEYEAERDRINAEAEPLLQAARTAARAADVANHEAVQLTWRDKMEADISGQREPVWASQPFWRDHTHIHGNHLVRVSINDSELLSYVADNAKGQRGIRTPIRPGKYLTQFFGDVLSEKQIAFFAQWQLTGAKPNQFSDPESFPLQFAQTPDEIEHVYKHGPSSCMDASHHWSEGESPVRVYGAGDLAVAYLEDVHGTQGAPRLANDEDGDDDDYAVRAIPARCLVWPEKKVMGRVYPAEGHDAHAELKNRLIKAGYVSLYTDNKLFNGARLLKERIERGKFRMPYVDIVDTIVDDGEYFRIRKNGDINAQQTCGYIRVTEPVLCACCHKPINRYEDMPVLVFTGTRPNDSYETQYHAACFVESDSYLCRGWGVRFANSVPHTEVNGSVYTNGWLAENAVYSDYSGRWFLNTRSAVRIHSLNENGSAVVKSAARSEYAEGREAGAFGTCAVVGTVWESRFMKRCVVTGALFSPTVRHPDFTDVLEYVDKETIAEYMKLSGSRAATQRAIKAAKAGLDYVPTHGQAKLLSKKAA